MSFPNGNSILSKNVKTGTYLKVSGTQKENEMVLATVCVNMADHFTKVTGLMVGCTERGD
jgi:hypothetical protein